MAKQTNPRRGFRDTADLEHVIEKMNEDQLAAFFWKEGITYSDLATNYTGYVMRYPQLGTIEKIYESSYDEFSSRTMLVLYFKAHDIHIKFTGTRDSYGDDKEYTRAFFVKPQEKTITVYE